ncbi:transposase [Leptospira interrogans serovar Hardjo-prajitno]|nr:transposase [Leptospira interrogans serovar Hardjo-prajitno]
MATQQSRPRIGVLVLSPDFVKSFRLFHFRRKEMESQEVKYVGVDCGKKSIEVVDLVELNLKLIEEEIQEALKKNKAYVQTIMSMPGIGMITSLAIMSYMGDCKRFSSAKQAAYYAGLVPRVDISGDTVRYGRIINRGCHSIRRVIVQAAWSLVRCQHGGKVKEFYQRLYLKKGAKKSIIATSRKMIEVLYVMIRTGKLFDSMPENILNRKLTQYGLM